MDVSTLTARAEEFLSKTSEEHYLNSSGIKDSLNCRAIFEDYSDLFAEGVYRILNGLLEGKPPDSEEARRLRYLREFVADGILSGRVIGLTDEIATRETRADVVLGRETVSYRAASVSLTNEADPDKRAAVKRAIDKVTVELNPLREERILELHSGARDLGFSSYLELYSTVTGIDYQALASLLRSFVERTDGLFTRRLERLAASELGMKLARVAQRDVGFLFRGQGFDASFPKERALPILEATLEGMGLDLTSQANIKVDAEVRPRKRARAFCSPIQVPSRVILCVMPHGGHDDYRAILHEAGHAEHFGNVDPGQPFEYRYLGDNAVTEGFAFVMDSLVSEPGWLSAYLGMSAPDVFVRFSTLKRLWGVRRYCAKLFYEISLHTAKGGSFADTSEDYAGWLTEVLKVEYPRHDYLVDLDDALYCANYLRAWLLGAQVTTYLRHRLGDRWFAYREAGDILREMWSVGQKYGPVELAKAVGFEGLAMEPLLEEIEGGLA